MRRLSRPRSSGCTATRCRRSIATTISPTTLAFGEYEIGVHHTPGHCPGGVCLAIGRKGIEEGGSLRRRYAVRRLDRQDRSAWRRSPDADSFDHAGAVCLRRCGAGVLRTRAADDDRPGAPDESVLAVQLAALRFDTINSRRPTDSLSPSFSSAVLTRLPLTNVPFVLPRSFS